MAKIRFSRAHIKKLRLKDTFETLGQWIVDSMKRHIRSKTGIDGSKVYANRPSTIRQKGKDHRMVNTGNFLHNAHIYHADDMGLTVTLRNSPHPKSSATYLQIGQWNQKGHSEQAVDAASDHFGLDDKTANKVYDALSKEIVKQLQKQVTYKATIDQVV